MFRFAQREWLWRPGETGPRPADDKYPGGGPFRPYRTCDYCGSMHPEDLIKAIEGGATVGGSDWKYGWPHKFYISHIPHDYEEVPVSFGGRYDAKGYTPEPPRPMGKSNGKWYNEHLKDKGFDKETFDYLTLLLGRLAGIVFHLTEEGKLIYSSPGYGYQAMGYTLATARFTEAEVLAAREGLKGYKHGDA